MVLECSMQGVPWHHELEVPRALCLGDALGSGWSHTGCRTGFLRVLCTGVPWLIVRSSNGCGQKALGMLYPKGSLASCLEPKWHGAGAFWSALDLSHLDKAAGAGVSTDQGCPGVCHTAAALEGLGLLGTSNFTEGIGQL